MRSYRSSAVAAGGAALCLAVAGCGSGAHTTVKPSTPVAAHGNAVLTAYTDSIEAKSAKVSLRETVSTGTTRPVTVTGSGVIDLGGAEGELTFAQPSLGSIREVVISPEVYIELPAKARGQIPGGKQWISLNIGKISEAKLGASLSQLSGSSQAPSQTLSYLDSVSDSVRTVGQQEIGGVETTEYDATLDLSRVVASKSPQVKAAVSKLESELHRSTLPVQVWIDAQHHVRQVTYALSITPTSGATAVHESLKLDLSSFGAPVTVKAPPASETYDATGAALKAGTSTS